LSFIAHSFLGSLNGNRGPWDLDVAPPRLPILRLNECVVPEFRNILHDRIIPNRREIVPLLETCRKTNASYSQVRTARGDVPKQQKKPQRGAGAKGQLKEMSKKKLGRQRLSRNKGPANSSNLPLGKQGRFESS
jgi:hypothetical protein